MHLKEIAFHVAPGIVNFDAEGTAPLTVEGKRPPWTVGARKSP